MISNNFSSPQPKVKNKGFVKASYAQTLASIPTAAASVGAMGLMRKIGNISKEDTITIKRSVSQALKDTGLKDDGVRAVFVETTKAKTMKGIFKSIINATMQPSKSDKKAMQVIADEAMGVINKNKFLKQQIEMLTGNSPSMQEEFQEIVERTSSLPIFMQLKTGMNACYLEKAKAVMIPDKNLIISGFHEIGHALNANKSKFWKFVQNNRKLCMLTAGYISTISLLTKKKADDETPAKGLKKVGHFVKKNAGALTFTAMLPVIAEEAMATIKGNKLASKMLDANLSKKVKIGNALGLATYILSAVGMSISTVVAIKVKDAAQAKYEAKIEKKVATKAIKLTTKN